MNVAIIGTGAMGSSLARRLSFAGHDVVLTGRDLGAARRIAVGIGEWARVADPRSAGRHAEVIIATTPAAAQVHALRSLGEGQLDAKIVVDVSNPPAQNAVSLSFETPSKSEELAAALPGVHVVKAFNTISANDLTSKAGLPIFHAGDHPRAKSAVHRLIESMAFVPVDVGSLRSARHLEAMGTLIGFVADPARALEVSIEQGWQPTKRDAAAG